MALNLTTAVFGTGGDILATESVGGIQVTPAMLFGTDGGGIDSDGHGGLKTNPAAGAVVALSNPPPTLNANSDTTLTFVQPIRHPRFQNNSATTKWIAFDTPATNGSLVAVAPGLLFSDDIPVTALHVWSSDAVVVNGVNGVAVWGFS